MANDSAISTQGFGDVKRNLAVGAVVARFAADVGIALGVQERP